MLAGAASVRWAAAVVAAAALSLYVATLAPNVGFVDSGELTLAAWDLGVPHPPGFPLYVLVTHLFTSIPIGSIAIRANAASALSAAFAAALVVPLTLRVVAGRRTGATLKAWILVAGGTTAALLFTSLRTPWSFATIAEVYALSALLVVVVWLLTWQGSAARVRVAAFVFGLSLGVHPPIAISSLPAFAVLMARAEGIQFFASRRVASLAALATLGATIYLYLPVAASRAPVLNWGETVTADRFWAHVSGWQYRGVSEFSGASFMQALQRFRVVLVQQFGDSYLPVALLLAAVGARVLFQSNRTAFWALATWITTNIVMVAVMNAAWSGEASDPMLADDDLSAYYLPTFIACCICAGNGTMWLLHRASRASHPRMWIAAMSSIIALAVGQSLIGNWTLNNRHDDRTAHTYVSDVLRSMRPGGLLLLRDWQLSSPLMYILHAERARPDVVVLDLSLMERRWYTDTLPSSHQSVLRPAHNELMAFRQLVVEWENDPGAVQRDGARRRALSRTFEALVIAVVSSHIRHAPVYVTYEVALGTDGKGATFAEQLRARYQLVPQGLLFELRPAHETHSLEEIPLQVESVRDAAARAGPDQVLSRHVIPVYRDMLISRALYLESHGRCVDAERPIAQALAIDPTSVFAKTLLTRCQAPTAVRQP